MWFRNLMLLFLLVLGLVLLLYGANYYNAPVGWTGVGLIVFVVFGYIVLKLLDTLTEKKG